VLEVLKRTLGEVPAPLLRAKVIVRCVRRGQARIVFA
jgi:hypothetical protein